MTPKEYLKLATDKTEAGDLIRNNNLTETILIILEDYAQIRVKNNDSLSDVGNSTDCNAEINYKGLCEICHTVYMLKD